MICSALLLAVLIQAPQTRPAPTTALRPYLNAGGAVTRLTGEQRYHRVGPPIAGTAFGLAGAVGALLSARHAIEGEIAFYRLSRPQTFGYNWTEEYTAGHRDLMVSLLLRSRFAQHLEFVGGGGLAMTRTTEQSKIRSPNGGTIPFTPTQLPDRDDHGGAFTLTAGIDGVIPASRRVSLVPTFRFRWLQRPKGTLAWLDGVGGYLLQFGIGIRVQ